MTAHVARATVQRGNHHGFAHIAVCSCGWLSRGYAREHAAQIMADDHLAQAEAVEVAFFAPIRTVELLAMNSTYLREYRAEPTPARRAAVEATSRELTRRGA
ncbi:hypothetical protein PBI_THONKO_4 [Mycobacterium phage Thonko]|uniref:Uncharacterized protein n=1 Tax=Mycobacterium phage Thonko TaxID=2282910 RepID=A0A346FC51_9CAUD|nr:hypothetical protein I5G57_gp004 [Mycobacterium phage Thonko]AXN53276.1 hypothetical protein PBI_THONKO_4 [Mycobacterium phage Thonko]